MVGLGNGRRGMKSPPLLVAALVACIIVLGFNYWIASSRSVDLQSRIMELEGRVRRAAAERGAVELKKNEFQGELKKQREQIDQIQLLHHSQLENANRIYRGEKEILMNNITQNERLIQNLQEQLKELQKEYGKLQLDVYRFQKNQTSLQKKFTYDMSQCISQMKELKEQCEERIEEMFKKGNEIPQDKEKKNLSGMSDKNDQVNIQVPTIELSEFQQHDLTKQGNEPQNKLQISDNSLKLEALKPTPIIKNPAELDYHKGTEDVINKEEEEIPVHKSHPQISTASTDHKELPPEPRIEQNPFEEVRNILGEVAVERQNGKVSELAGHPDAKRAKAEDEEVEREHLLNDDLQQDDQETSRDGEFGIKRASQENKGVEYNLDVNEAESETDKQAALVDHQDNFNVKNLEDLNIQNHLFKLGEEHQQKL
ncbi:Golgi membrane protein 1 [Hemicordylus capensis]|uniref:Golgi membrane protein 1 n=1 Tax=Hemicordylus capensis TaxID=884348 RepID=UPI0023026990|nr:Golgi membrane protein 1 [Hemicordylus capensis]